MTGIQPVNVSCAVWWKR